MTSHNNAKDNYSVLVIIECMDVPFLFVRYFIWHYGRAYVDMFVVWANLLWFVVHFFSIPRLLKTLFSPWKRMTETVGKKDFEDIAGSIVVNLMSRVLGAFVRLILVVFGLVLMLLMSVGILVFAFYLAYFSSSGSDFFL